MNEFLIKSTLGLIYGLFLGTTGIAPTGLVLLILDMFNFGDYKSNLGAILLLNLFPLSTGSFYEFYKVKQVDFSLTYILLITAVIGSLLGSKLAAGEKAYITIKGIKYITAFLSLFVGINFLYSAYYEKN
jgi:uncharacterized membrane protein YfcA